jgi:hypothetical protein
LADNSERLLFPNSRRIVEGMANLIEQAEHILATAPPLPENRTAPCRELLQAALALTNDLLSQAKLPAAAALGRKGGSTTSRRHGPEHYRQMAAKRKIHGGGRPRKES